MIKVLEKLEDFVTIIKEDKNVLVDFYATWCGPCRMMGRVMEEIEDEEKDITFLKVDTDEFPEIASDYDVSSIPSLFLLKDGKPVANKLGFANVKQLQAFVHQAGELTF